MSSVCLVVFNLTFTQFKPKPTTQVPVTLSVPTFIVGMSSVLLVVFNPPISQLPALSMRAHSSKNPIIQRNASNNLKIQNPIQTSISPPNLENNAYSKYPAHAHPAQSESRLLSPDQSKQIQFFRATIP